LCIKKQIHMTSDQIKVGDIIRGAYRYSSIMGKVIKVLKNKVVIQRHHVYFNEHTPTDEEVNVTLSRVYEIMNPEKIIIK